MDHVIGKERSKIKTSERVLIEKVCQLFGTFYRRILEPRFKKNPVIINSNDAEKRFWS